ncbi:extracellular solute-binding protein [bacterium]|jgi:ABC-type glycerol-3-phosphate transport system substrate-binding protein|nr:extracellular solute-binding protein [bacterium]
MVKVRFLIIILLAVFLVTTGFGCKQNIINKEKFQPITLQYWGVWDTPEQMQSIIKAYTATHPTIKVEYKNFRYDEYEQKLLEAAWEDRVPDVFMIPASWLLKYQDRLQPMPKSMQIPILEMQGTIKPEAVTTLKTINSLSLHDIKERYVDVVYDNTIMDGKIYGLPYSVDTLVTFYNSDLLTAASVPEPMEDFHDLVEQIQNYNLSKITTGNNIFQSGVAMGGTDNVPRFFDILSSIMLQNEVELKGSSFDPLANRTSAQHMAEAIGFYSDFANSTKAVFSWDDSLPDAFEMFTQGKLAYFFGYSYHADELRKRGVQFDWEMTNFPKTRGAEGTKYYSNYWVNVVPQKSKNTDAAWNFIQSTASKNLVVNYLNDNNKPTALRTLISSQLEDDEIRVFASQVLTADNWYQGYDIMAAEQYMAEFVDSVLDGSIQLDSDGLEFLVSRIYQTYQSQ